MAIPVRCTCGSSFTLKDEYAGQLLKCPNCGNQLQAGAVSVSSGGAAAAAAPALAPVLDPLLQRDKFLLRQKHFSISEKYYVSDEQGNAIAFVQRPAHLARNVLAIVAGVIAGMVWIAVVAAAADAVSAGSEAAIAALIIFGFLSGIAILVLVAVGLSAKRHVTFYRDDKRTERLLEVLQDRKLQFLNATYTVRDAQANPIARLRKNYLYNIFRKRWYCNGPDDRVLCVAKEDSILLSLLRRFLGPLFGLLRTNFILCTDASGNTVLGEFNRKFTILDRYVLDLTPDASRSLDRRIALALGVMLDTGERR